MVGEELPDAIRARVIERVQTGESVLDVAAWLVDLGYWTTPEDVAIVARHRQQHDAADGEESGSPGTEGRGQP